ncbi:hypothetical protein ACWD4V_18250 [Streptomyces tsukubensis]
MSEGALASAFVDVAARAGWKWAKDPWQSYQSWSDFVQECVDGYGMDYSEYIHDSLVRDLIGEFLADDAARNASGFKEFIAAVQEVDEKFRALISRGPVVLPEEERWWRRSLPPTGGEEFVNDVEERLRVALERIS